LVIPPVHVTLSRIAQPVYKYLLLLHSGYAHPVCLAITRMHKIAFFVHQKYPAATCAALNSSATHAMAVTALITPQVTICLYSAASDCILASSAVSNCANCQN
jgi:hypothetical protein